jgi:hypothetical protein
MDSARRRKWRRVFFHHRIKQLTHSDRKVFSVPTLGCAQHPIGSRGASLDGTWRHLDVAVFASSSIPGSEGDVSF